MNEYPVLENLGESVRQRYSVLDAETPVEKVAVVLKWPLELRARGRSPRGAGGGVRTLLGGAAAVGARRLRSKGSGVRMAPSRRHGLR